MIGLGSNRLTVCRRGGMSVTQAGRGGMEWLAGGRRPRWSSPYSVQATAALKAQFPTQWATIRDYGFAHPEIVGYMNAYAPEDAKIAYSLVEGIGTRDIKFDGNSWLDAEIALNSCSELFAEVNLIVADMALFGNSASNYAGLIQWGNAVFYVNNIRAGSYSAGWANITVTTTKLTYNGDARTYNTTFNSSNLIIGKVAGSANSQNNFRSFGYITNGVRHTWVPFIHNDNGTKKNGMLDLVSGTFYQNAGSGSFTISETPAS